MQSKISVENEQEFGQCADNGHAKKSIYPKDKVPIIYFLQNPEKSNSRKCVNCLDCRKHNRKMLTKNLEKALSENPENENNEFMICHNTGHNNITSLFPMEQVPSDLFLQDPNNPNSKRCKTCIYCRLYKRKTGKRYVEKIKLKNANEQNVSEFKHCPNTSCNEKIKPEKVPETEFKACPNTGHNSVVGSQYPCDKVPLSLFRIDSNDPNSNLRKNCSDCRKYEASKRKNDIKNKKEIAESNNQKFCTQCHHPKELSEMSLNHDGTPSIHCIPCKEFQRNRNRRVRKTYLDIKFEFVLKNESCCERCQCIYLYGENPFVSPDLMNKSLLSKIETKERDGIRYVTLKDGEHKVKDVLMDLKPYIELFILQLDHLTEEEQRARGILLPDQSFIPKKRQVCKMSSESAIRLEARKTQLLCATCHLIITIERENGIAYNSRSHLERQKLEYLLVFKNKGCSICDYVNTECPRLFHFDHLDPADKLKDIGRMTKDNKYTFEQLKEEVAKCQVICLHCHILHTREQRYKGIISNMPRKTTITKKINIAKISSNTVSHFDKNYDSNTDDSNDNSENDLEMKSDIDSDIEFEIKENSKISRKIPLPQISSINNAGKIPLPRISSINNAGKIPLLQISSINNLGKIPLPRISSINNARKIPLPQISSINNAGKIPLPQISSINNIQKIPLPQISSINNAGKIPLPQISSINNAGKIPLPQILSINNAGKIPLPQISSMDNLTLSINCLNISNSVPFFINRDTTK